MTRADMALVKPSAIAQAESSKLKLFQPGLAHELTRPRWRAIVALAIRCAYFESARKRDVYQSGVKLSMSLLATSEADVSRWKQM